MLPRACTSVRGTAPSQITPLRACMRSREASRYSGWLAWTRMRVSSIRYLCQNICMTEFRSAVTPKDFSSKLSLGCRNRLRLSLKPQAVFL